MVARDVNLAVCKGRRKFLERIFNLAMGRFSAVQAPRYDWLFSQPRRRGISEHERFIDVN